jgi:hypothetical protein
VALKRHCIGVLERCTHVVLEGVVVLEVDQIVQHGVIGPLMDDGGDLHREGGEQLKGWRDGAKRRALPASTAPRSTADLNPDSTFLSSFVVRSLSKHEVKTLGRLQ